MKYPWFRMYSEARIDAKLDTLTDAQHRVWHRLLCYAAEQEDRGCIAVDDMELLAIEVAKGDVALLAETLARCVKLRIITQDGDRITFTHFLERQYDKESDMPEATRERKRQQRERARQAAEKQPEQSEEPPQTPSVTQVSRDVTPGHGQRREEERREEHTPQDAGAGDAGDQAEADPAGLAVAGDDEGFTRPLPELSVLAALPAARRVHGWQFGISGKPLVAVGFNDAAKLREFDRQAAALQAIAEAQGSTLEEMLDTHYDLAKREALHNAGTPLFDIDREVRFLVRVEGPKARKGQGDAAGASGYGRGADAGTGGKGRHGAGGGAGAHQGVHRRHGGGRGAHPADADWKGDDGSWGALDAPAGGGAGVSPGAAAGGAAGGSPA